MSKILSYDKILSFEEKQQIIKDYVNGLLSIREVARKYNIKSKEYIVKLLGDKVRSENQGKIIAHKKHPENYKHSEETKNKLREIRLKFMAAHPEQTAWRRKNMSYLERMFDKLLKENGYYDKYKIVREFSVFPYFIDFAFINGKIAVEIDGSQHLLEERKKKDEEKDKLLIEQGWRVLRISEKTVKTDWDIIIKTLDNLLSENSDIDVYILGKLEKPKSYIKKECNKSKVKKCCNKSRLKERNENGRTEAEVERILKSRKVKNRPTKEELIKLLRENSFVGVGRMFDVSDNAVRKWCKTYNIPYHTKFYKNNC